MQSETPSDRVTPCSDTPNEDLNASTNAASNEDDNEYRLQAEPFGSGTTTDGQLKSQHSGLSVRNISTRLRAARYAAKEYRLRLRLVYKLSDWPNVVSRAVDVSDADSGVVITGRCFTKGILFKKRDVQLYRPDNWQPYLTFEQSYSTLNDKKWTISDTTRECGRIRATREHFWQPLKVRVELYNTKIAKFDPGPPGLGKKMLLLVVGIFLVCTWYAIYITGPASWAISWAISAAMELFTNKIVFSTDDDYAMAVLGPTGRFENHSDGSDSELCLILSVLRLFETPCVVPAYNLTTDALKPLSTLY